MVAKNLTCPDFIVLIIKMHGCLFVRSGMYVSDLCLQKCVEVLRFYKVSGGRKRTLWLGDLYEQLR